MKGNVHYILSSNHVCHFVGLFFLNFYRAVDNFLKIFKLCFKDNKLVILLLIKSSTA